ncbi:hypothetical protein LCGC14_0464760 [marine sediment metagenome]|uniref:Uncharacterized protein n=1 Tax=marine sediment metagenome TaxID=412755 RepID=A0A0F9SJ93_9ZZZZ
MITLPEKHEKCIKGIGMSQDSKGIYLEMEFNYCPWCGESLINPKEVRYGVED